MTEYSPQLKDPQIQAELQRIAQIITSLGEHIWVEEFAEPEKPRKGMVRFADGTTWDPGSGAGMYLYNGATWNFLQGAGGSGETNTVSNVGGEKEVSKAKVGVNFPFRTLKEGLNVTITQNANDVEIASSGLQNVVEDLTPELGGDLDALEKDINNLSIAHFVYTGTSDGYDVFTDVNGYLQIDSNDPGYPGLFVVCRGDHWWSVDPVDSVYSSPPTAGDEIYFYNTITDSAFSEFFAGYGFFGTDSFDIGNYVRGGDFIISVTTPAGVPLRPIKVNPTALTVDVGPFVFDIDQTVGASEDNYVLTYDDGDGQISLEPATGGGTDFLDITEFDDTDSTYYFYGGEDDAGDWQVNRYHKTTFVVTRADEVGDPAYTTLAAAWPNRLTLTYS